MPLLPWLVGIEFWPVIAFVVLAALAITTPQWLRSFLSPVVTARVQKPSRSFWGKVWYWISPVQAYRTVTQVLPHALAAPFVHMLRNIEQTVVAAVTHAALAQTAPITRLLRGIETIQAQTALHIKGLAAATYHALDILVTDTIPDIARDIVAPVREIAIDARTLATEAENRLTIARDALLAALAATGIGSFTTLAQGLTALVNYADRLHDKVWNDVVPKLEQAITVSIPALGDQIAAELNDLYNSGIDSLDGIRTRLREIEDFLGTALNTPLEWIIAALGTAAGLVALEGVLTRIMPEFFCKNTRGVAKKLCGLDETLIEALLAGALGLLVVIDPVAIAEAALATEGAIEPVIREVAT